MSTNKYPENGQKMPRLNFQLNFDCRWQTVKSAPICAGHSPALADQIKLGTYFFRNQRLCHSPSCTWDSRCTGKYTDRWSRRHTRAHRRSCSSRTRPTVERPPRTAPAACCSPCTTSAAACSRGGRPTGRKHGFVAWVRCMGFVAWVRCTTVATSRSVAGVARFINTCE
jgi:hypothetical protein